MASTDAGVTGPTRARIEEKTLRGDRWWLAPLLTFVVFAELHRLRDVRAFMGRDYYSSPYLSPFYSPCLGDCVEGASDFGQPFAWFPLSAALIILIFPLGFRMTCYYYRKAYYRAVLAVAAGLRRGRAARQVLRRDPVPADPAERPPLLLVRRDRGRLHPHLRRGAGIPQRGPASGATPASARC